MESGVGRCFIWSLGWFGKGGMLVWFWDLGWWMSVFEGWLLDIVMFLVVCLWWYLVELVCVVGWFESWFSNRGLGIGIVRYGKSLLGGVENGYNLGLVCIDGGLGRDLLIL